MNVEILDASGRPIKSAADASEEAARVFAGLATGTRPPRRGTTELVVAYTEMPGLRQVVQRIAESEASIPFVVYRSKNAAGRSTRDHKLQSAHGARFHHRAKQMMGAGDLEELENDLIVQFLDRGNPCLSGFECRQVMGTHFELVGECFAWIERNRLGVPQFYWPLPPSWVADVPAPGQGFFEIQIAGARRKVEARDMLYIRDPDPSNPYGRGSGIAASLADELDTDEYAARFLKAFFYNDATPSLAVVWPGGTPTPEQMKEIEQKMMEKHRGAEKGFRVHMFNSNPQIHQFARSLKDMTVVELRKFLYELIRQTWGLPPEVLGVIENSNRATIDAAAFLMGLFILMPRLSRWRIALQTQLVPQFDERKVIGFESPVPEDENRKLEIAKAATWALSRAEWREWLGYETEPTDEVYLQPMTLEERAVGEPAPPAPEPTPATGGAGGDEPPDEPAADDVEEPEDDEGKARVGREPYPRRWWPPQAGDTIGKAAVLDLGDVDRLTALVDPQLLTRQTEDLWSRELRAWGDRMLGELGVSASFNIINPRVSEHLRTFAGERITRINNGVRDAVRAQLVAAVEAGEGYKDVARRIEDVFDDARGRRAAAIARTEPAISANWGTWEAQRQSGVVQKRAWVSTPDDRAREQHLEMDGKVVGIEEPFTFPDGTTTMAPCLSGVAEHDINCVLPETQVDGVVVGAARSLYEGRALEIKMASGVRLRVTPNHKVLSGGRWVRAKELCAGDDVLCYRGQVDDLLRPTPRRNVDDVPPCIEQVFGAFAAVGVSSRVGLAAVDFDGDERLVKGDVDVVDVHGVLQRRGLRAADHVKDLSLVATNAMPGAVVGFRSLGQLRDAAFEAARRSLGWTTDALDDRGPFGGIKSPDAFPLLALCVGAAAKIHAGPLHVPRQGRATDPALLGELFHALPGFVTPDQVVEIRDVEFRGHVYDVETASGWFLANGIVVHNCRCTTVAVIEDKAVHDSASKDFDDDLIVWEGRAERAFRRAFGAQAAAVERELKAIAARRGQL